ESESPAKKSGRRHALEGIASYYKHGKKTASGEPFDQRAMTAAHPTLPFNSLVRVTDRTNGKSVVVRINDRGPFVAGRVIDLSEAAAEAIGMTRRGVTPVRLEVLSMPEKSQKNWRLVPGFRGPFPLSRMKWLRFSPASAGLANWAQERHVWG